MVSVPNKRSKIILNQIGVRYEAELSAGFLEALFGEEDFVGLPAALESSIFLDEALLVFDLFA